MVSNSKIREQTYAYFLTEAQDLLRTIEQHLLTLRQSRTPAQVHELMRSAHTLKGAAASVGFDSIKSIAHSLEEVFKALYKPEVNIDAELEALLFEAYECLRVPLARAIAGESSQDAALVTKSADAVFARIKAKLGQHFDPGAALPTSADLGFDIVRSLFETGVRERLEQLENALNTQNTTTIAQVLQTQADVFVGLAESLNLPGFGAIAQNATVALRQHPNQAVEIAQAALADFRQGQMAVLSGDRTVGGEVSDPLKQWATDSSSLSERKTGFLTVQTAWSRLKQMLDSSRVSLRDRLVSQTVVETVEPQSELFSLDPALEDLANEFDRLDSEPPETETMEGYELWSDHAESVSPTLPNAIEPPFNPSKVDGEQTLLTVPGLAAQTTAAPKVVRVNLEHLESLNCTTSELLIHQNQQTVQDEQLQARLAQLLERFKSHHQRLSKLQTLIIKPERRSVMLSETPLSNESGLRTTFDALELDRYNEFNALLQSASNEAAQLEAETEAIGFLARECQFACNKQGRLLTNLRDDLLAVRMIPIATVLDRIAPVVQQMVETYGKQVELRLVGTQVLIDKALAEQLYDPLLHLVRNAFDHGIEAEPVRRQRGKPIVGCIEIRAFQQGNRTVVEVRDDGRGVDLQRVCDRGVELQLLTSNQADRFSQVELLNLLFEPGFSTAQQVTELSGRGIGLDVVRSRIRSMQGNITVTSKPNVGTVFVLQLPLTLISARLLVCQVGQSIVGLLSDEVERIMSEDADEIETLQNRRILHLPQARTIPVHTLSDLMSYTTWVAQRDAHRPQETISNAPTLIEPQPSELQKALIVLLHGKTNPIALSVDRILAEQELIVRPISRTIAAPNYVYGCSLLGDGRMMLVIDGAAIVEAVPTQPGTPIPPFQVEHSLPTAKTVLVVDDSITVRQSLALTLENAGYVVLQACDGQDAINILRHAVSDSLSIQLITCDIEMPRLNGFEFLMQYAQDPKLPRVPVIMLTSRTQEKHQQLAMQLGASSYLTKPFVESTLLQTVEQFIQQVPS